MASFASDAHCVSERLTSSVPRPLSSLTNTETRTLLQNFLPADHVALLNETVNGTSLSNTVSIDGFVQMGFSIDQACELSQYIEIWKNYGVPECFVINACRTATSASSATSPSTIFNESAQIAEPGNCADRQGFVDQTAQNEHSVSEEQEAGTLFDDAYRLFYKRFWAFDASAKSDLQLLADNGNHMAKAYLMVLLSADTFGGEQSRAVHMAIELHRDSFPKWLESHDVVVQMHAEFIVGYCCEFGVGCSEDKVQAVDWYRRSADKGHAEAQYWLGVCFLDGNGVPADKDQAIRCWEKAALHNHWGANNRLKTSRMAGSSSTIDWGI